MGFGRGDRPQPLEMARRPFPDPFAAMFPASANDLMAERARRTAGVLRALREELAAFPLHALAKLGMPTRSGSREHCWFEIHDMDDTTLDGTLVNQPFDVDLREGDRGRHDLDLLTDWTLITPAGWITPRSQFPARVLRARGPEILAAIREHERR